MEYSYSWLYPPFFADGQDPKPAGKVWTAVDELSDEFEGTSLDTDKWQAEPVGNGWMWDRRAAILNAG